MAIIKTINLQDNIDYSIYQELIATIKNQNEIITVIISSNSHLLYENIMISCILGTLEATNLINICTYEEDAKSGTTNLTFIEQEKISFLPFAWYQFYKLLSLVKTSLL